MEEAIAEGAQVLFATTPPLIAACRKIAARHPGIRILNCSVSMPYTGVRTYYSRIYEGKFITGAIAGAMAQNDRVGYVASYHQWLSMGEFTDLVTIAEMTPGPIAVNSATFVGTKIAGIPGALVATAGCILPACILVTLIARLYLKYRNIAVLQSVLGSLRPAVVAMIASAGVLILRNAFWSGAIRLSGTNWNMVALFAAAFLLLRRTKLSPILVMLLAGAANLVISLITP